MWQSGPDGHNLRATVHRLLREHGSRPWTTAITLSMRQWSGRRTEAWSRRWPTSRVWMSIRDARRWPHPSHPPWSGFREAVAAQVDRIIVSHRADHGRTDPAARAKGRDQTTGPLHLDTAYGLTGHAEKGVPLVVTRKPFDSLTPAMIDKIRDEHLRAALSATTRGKDGKAFAEALGQFRSRPGPYHGISRVRLIEPISVIEIRDASGRAYKG